jgi:hypothetical protein
VCAYLCDYRCWCCRFVSWELYPGTLYCTTRLIIYRSFTIFISVFAVIGLLVERRDGNIKLEAMDDEYSDELLPGHANSEKL